MAETWPAGLLIPRAPTIALLPRNLAGPPSLSGRTQVVASDAAIWSAAFEAVAVRTREQVLAWRALEAQLMGRLGTVLVPFYAAYQPNNGAVPLLELLAGTGRTNRMTVAADAAARASTLSVAIAWGGPPEPGHGFSLGERYYRIARVPALTPTSATLSIVPYLRDAVAAGTELVFHRPVCRMRLASDTEMRLSLELNRFGAPTVNFIEDV